MIGGLLIFPILFLFVILFIILWIMMLIDAATRKFSNDNDKIVWILIIIITGFIGALIYYFIIYKKYKSLKWFWIALLILVALVLVLFITIYCSATALQR
jgi:prolipoprotein diacylglyceryltransferase